jgi:hypothetical protein
MELEESDVTCNSVAIATGDSVLIARDLIANLPRRIRRSSPSSLMNPLMLL